MKLSKSNTRAFAVFHRFHEQLNLSLKTSVVGVIFLKDVLTRSTYTIDEVKDVCYKDKSLWGGMPGWGTVEGANAAIKATIQDLGCSGVIRAFSAFDVFLETLDAELGAWKAKRQQLISAAQGSKKSPSVKHYLKALEAEAALAVKNQGLLIKNNDADDSDGEADSLGRAIRFYNRNNWSTATVSHLLPVYTYYRRLRNCIAHTNARATPGLIEASNDSSWGDALEKWKKVSADITLPAPHIHSVGQEIAITHKDAILASSMLRAMALDMTQKAIQILREDGMVHLAASRLLKHKDPIVVGGKNQTSVFHNHMEEIYRVKEMSHPETRKILERLGHWKEWTSWHQSIRDEVLKERSKKKVEQEKTKNYSRKSQAVKSKK